jgi:hypothetical protein
MLRSRITGAPGSDDDADKHSKLFRTAMRSKPTAATAQSIRRLAKPLDSIRTTALLLTLAALLMLVTFLFPKQVESEATAMAHQALEAERQMMDWWSKEGHPKPPLAATSKDHSWVEGEKRLKQKLKVLAARQAQGKDLGVPVLTRYLGEDVPAWAGEGVDVDEWRKLVDEKYAQMREDEIKWQDRIIALLEKEKERG